MNSSCGFGIPLHFSNYIWHHSGGRSGSDDVAITKTKIRMKKIHRKQRENNVCCKRRNIVLLWPPYSYFEHHKPFHHTYKRMRRQQRNLSTATIISVYIHLQYSSIFMLNELQCTTKHHCSKWWLSSWFSTLRCRNQHFPPSRGQGFYLEHSNSAL